MKILIVEDELITATDLKETLEKYHYTVTGIARNVKEVKELLDFHIPDLVLIDIHLKNSPMGGVEVAAFLNSGFRIPFVFLTANTDPATYNEASQTRPAAYLLKPYRHKELAFQIDLAYRNFTGNLADNADPLTSDAIFLPYGKGYQRIEKKEILFIKADGSYVNIRVRGDDQPYKFTMNIGYLAQFFDSPSFFQLSRSYLINLLFLERFDASHIYLKDYNEKIPIPQNRKQEFLKRVAVIKTP